MLRFLKHVQHFSPVRICNIQFCKAAGQFLFLPQHGFGQERTLIVRTLHTLQNRCHSSYTSIETFVSQLKLQIVERKMCSNPGSANHFLQNVWFVPKPPTQSIRWTFKNAFSYDKKVLHCQILHRIYTPKTSKKENRQLSS